MNIKADSLGLPLKFIQFTKVQIHGARNLNIVFCQVGPRIPVLHFVIMKVSGPGRF